MALSLNHWISSMRFSYRLPGMFLAVWIMTASLLVKKSPREHSHGRRSFQSTVKLCFSYFFLMVSLSSHVSTRLN